MLCCKASIFGIKMNNILWKISKTPIAYEAALEEMAQIVDLIIAGKHPETIWLLEHPPLYTAGTSAKKEDLLSEDFLPVHHVGRGGEYTYHGPGQIVGYLMLDLNTRKKDIRWFVQEIEHWLIETLNDFSIDAGIREGRVGLWVAPNTETKLQIESKIAAIGIRVKKWVSFHGFALNVSPNLEHYKGIIPCGINDYGVTSFKALQKNTDLERIKQKLIKKFEHYF